VSMATFYICSTFLSLSQMFHRVPGARLEVGLFRWHVSEVGTVGGIPDYGGASQLREGVSL
jgi:hypothetical protein